MATMQLFPDTVDGRRRGVLFAFAVIAGLLSIASVSILVAIGKALLLAATMAGAGGLALVFAGLLYLGRFDDLTSDDQLLWTLAQ